MSSREMKMLKAVIPFLHPGLRPILLLLCSVWELKAQCQELQTAPVGLPPGEAPIVNRERLFQTLSPLCSQKEREMLQQFQSMEEAMRMFQMYQTFSSAAAENGENGDPMAFFMQMLTPEQQETMEMMKMMMESSNAS
ncbi:MAG: hypothetical protein Q4C48_03155 [Lachnospiraceae bacterium]|nr:hypothetical protein [Lachnospiraceae bacterium]